MKRKKRVREKEIKRTQGSNLQTNFLKIKIN